jgi:hypothetical protein
MKEIGLAALFVAFGLSLSGCSQPQTSTDAGTTQPQTFTDPETWRVLGAPPGQTPVVYYRRPVLKQPDKLPRLWLRWEHSTAQDDLGGPQYRSDVMLSEFDCVKGRYRQLGFMAYAENNLAGPVVAARMAEGPWTYPTPGSVGDGAQKVVCG